MYIYIHTKIRLFITLWGYYMLTPRNFFKSYFNKNRVNLSKAGVCYNIIYDNKYVITINQKYVYIYTQKYIYLLPYGVTRC